MVGFPKDVLGELTTHLEEELARITKRIDELSQQDPFSDPDRVNDNAASDVEASEESSHDRFAAMVDELKENRSSIDAALDRIAKGTYGFCKHCGQMIDTDRLAVLPTATLCLDCEKKKSREAGSRSAGK